MSQATNTALLISLRDEANSAAWQEFSSRYRPVLLAFAQRLGLGEHDAQDVAQETLLAFLESYRQDKYERDKGRLRSWLLGIARNKILYLRRKKGRQIQPQDETGRTGFFERLPDEASTGEIWEAEWQRAIVAACLQEVRQQFEPTTIQAFEMLSLRERPTEEVAASLGMSTNAVLKANRRVLSRMRELHTRFEKEW